MAIGAGCAAHVIEKVELEAQGGEEVFGATVRPTRSRQGRCGRCGRRAPRYDNGEGAPVAGPRRGHEPGVSAGSGAAGGLPYPWCDRLPRCRGRVMGPGSPARLRTLRRGWPAMPRSPCWRRCCGSAGGRGRCHHRGGVAPRAAQTDRLNGLRRIGVGRDFLPQGPPVLISLLVSGLRSGIVDT